MVINLMSDVRKFFQLSLLFVAAVCIVVGSSAERISVNDNNSVVNYNGSILSDLFLDICPFKSSTNVSTCSSTTSTLNVMIFSANSTTMVAPGVTIYVTVAPTTYLLGQQGQCAYRSLTVSLARLNFMGNNTIVFRGPTGNNATTASALCNAQVTITGAASTSPTQNVDILFDDVSVCCRSVIAVDGLDMGGLLVLGESWNVTSGSSIIFRNSTMTSLQRGGYAWRRLTLSSLATLLPPSFFGVIPNRFVSGASYLPTPGFASNASVLVFSSTVSISSTSLLEFLSCYISYGMYFMTNAVRVEDQSGLLILNSIIGRPIEYKNFEVPAPGSTQLPFIISSPIGIVFDFSATATIAAQLPTSSEGAIVFRITNASSFSVNTTEIEVFFDVRRWNFTTGAYEVSGPTSKFNTTMLGILPFMKKFEPPTIFGGIVINFAYVGNGTTTAAIIATTAGNNGVFVTSNSTFTLWNSSLNVKMITTSSARFVNTTPTTGGSAMLQCCGTCFNAKGSTAAAVVVRDLSRISIERSVVAPILWFVYDYDNMTKSNLNATTYWDVMLNSLSAVAFEFFLTTNASFIIGNGSSISATTNSSLLTRMINVEFGKNGTLPQDPQGTSDKAEFLSAQSLLVGFRRSIRFQFYIAQNSTFDLVSNSSNARCVDAPVNFVSTATPNRSLLCSGVLMNGYASQQPVMWISDQSSMAMSSNSNATGDRSGVELSLIYSTSASVVISGGSFFGLQQYSAASGLFFNFRLTTSSLLSISQRSFVGIKSNAKSVITSVQHMNNAILLEGDNSTQLTVRVDDASGFGVTDAGASTSVRGPAIYIWMSNTNNTVFTIRNKSWVGAQGVDTDVLGLQQAIMVDLDNSWSAVVTVDYFSFFGGGNGIQLPALNSQLYSGVGNDGASILFTMDSTFNSAISIVSNSVLGLINRASVATTFRVGMTLSAVSSVFLTISVSYSSVLGISDRSSCSSFYYSAFCVFGYGTEYMSIAVVQGSTFGAAAGSNLSVAYPSDGIVAMIFLFSYSHYLDINVIGRVEVSPQSTVVPVGSIPSADHVMRSVLGVSNTITDGPAKLNATPPNVRLACVAGSILQFDFGSSYNVNIQLLGSLNTVNLSTSPTTVLDQCGGAVLGTAGSNFVLATSSTKGWALALLVSASVNITLTVDGNGCPFSLIGVEVGPTAQAEQNAAAQYLNSSSPWTTFQTAFISANLIVFILATSLNGLVLQVRGGARFGVSTSQPMQLVPLPNLTKTSMNVPPTLLRWTATSQYGVLLNFADVKDVSIEVDGIGSCVGMCFGRLQLVRGDDNATGVPPYWNIITVKELVVTRFSSAFSSMGFGIEFYFATRFQLNVNHSAVVGFLGPQVASSSSFGTTASLYQSTDVAFRFDGGSLFGAAGGADVVAQQPVIIQYQSVQSLAIVLRNKSLVGAADYSTLTYIGGASGVAILMDSVTDALISLAGQSTVGGRGPTSIVAAQSNSSSVSRAVQIIMYYSNYTMIDVNEGSVIGADSGARFYHGPVSIESLPSPSVNFTTTNPPSRTISHCGGVLCLRVRGRSRIGVSGSRGSYDPSIALSDNQRFYYASQRVYHDARAISPVSKIAGNITADAVVMFEMFMLTSFGSSFGNRSFILEILVAEESVIGFADNGAVDVAVPTTSVSPRATATSMFSLVIFSIFATVEASLLNPRAVLVTNPCWNITISGGSFFGLDNGTVIGPSPSLTFPSGKSPIASAAIQLCVEVEMVNLKNAAVTIENVSGVGMRSSWFSVNGTSVIGNPQLLPISVGTRCVGVRLINVSILAWSVQTNSFVGLSNVSVSVANPSVAVQFSVTSSVLVQLVIRSQSFIGLSGAATHIQFVSPSYGNGVALTMVACSDSTTTLMEHSLVGIGKNSTALQSSAAYLEFSSCSRLSITLFDSVVGADRHSTVSTVRNSVVYISFSASVNASLFVQGDQSVFGTRAATVGSMLILDGALSLNANNTKNFLMHISHGASFGLVDASYVTTIDGSAMALSIKNAFNFTLVADDRSIVGIGRGSQTKTASLIENIIVVISDDPSSFVVGGGSTFQITNRSCFGCCDNSSSQPLNQFIAFVAASTTQFQFIVSDGSFFGVAGNSTTTSSINMNFQDTRGLQFLVTNESGCGFGSSDFAVSTSLQMSLDSAVAATVRVEQRSTIGYWASSSSMTSTTLVHVTFVGATSSMIRITEQSTVGVVCSTGRTEEGGVSVVRINFISTTGSKILLQHNSYVGVVLFDHNSTSLLFSLATSGATPSLLTSVQVMMNASRSFLCQIDDNSGVGWLRSVASGTQSNNNSSSQGIEVVMSGDGANLLQLVITRNSFVGISGHLPAFVNGTRPSAGSQSGMMLLPIGTAVGVLLSLAHASGTVVQILSSSALGVVLCCGGLCANNSTSSLSSGASTLLPTTSVITNLANTTTSTLQLDMSMSVNSSISISDRSLLGIYHNYFEMIHDDTGGRSDDQIGVSPVSFNLVSSVNARVEISMKSCVGIGSGSSFDISAPSAVVVNGSSSKNLTILLSDGSLLGIGDVDGSSTAGVMPLDRKTTLIRLSSSLRDVSGSGFVTIVASNISASSAASSPSSPLLIARRGSVIGVLDNRGIGGDHYAPVHLAVSEFGTLSVIFISWNIAAFPETTTNGGVAGLLALSNGSTLGVSGSSDRTFNALGRGPRIEGSAFTAQNITSVVQLNVLRVDPVSGLLMSNVSVSRSNQSIDVEVLNDTTTTTQPQLFDFSDSSIAIDNVKCSFRAPSVSARALLSLIGIVTTSPVSALRCSVSGSTSQLQQQPSVSSCIRVANVDLTTLTAGESQLSMISVGNRGNTSQASMLLDIPLQTTTATTGTTGGVENCFIDASCNVLSGLLLRQEWYDGNAVAGRIQPSNIAVNSSVERNVVMWPPMSPLTVTVNNAACEPTTSLTLTLTTTSSNAYTLQSATLVPSISGGTPTAEMSASADTLTLHHTPSRSLITSATQAPLFTASPTFSVSQPLTVTPQPPVTAFRTPPKALQDILSYTTSPTGLLSSIAMPISAGPAIRRMLTLSTLGKCSDDVRPTVGDKMDGDSADYTPLDSPLQLKIGRDSAGSSHRGTVVGNLAVFAICVFASLLLVALLYSGGSPPSPTSDLEAPANVADITAAEKQSSQLSARFASLVCHAAKLRLPGMYFVVVSLLLQPTVTASLLILIYGEDGSDAVIGAAGFFATILVVCGIGRVLDPRRVHFRAVARRMRVGSNHHDNSDQENDDPNSFAERRLRSNRSARWGATMVAVLEWCQNAEMAKVRWCPRHNHSDKLFVQRYGFLFEGCNDRRHWWLMVEMLCTVVIGILSGIVPNSEMSCLAIAWCALAVCVCAFLAVVALHPMNSQVETIVVNLLWGAQVAMASCAVAGSGDEVALVLGIIASLLSGILAAMMVVHVVRSQLAKLSMERSREEEGDVAEPINIESKPNQLGIFAEQTLSYHRLRGKRTTLVEDNILLLSTENEMQRPSHHQNEYSNEERSEFDHSSSSHQIGALAQLIATICYQHETKPSDRRTGITNATPSIQNTRTVPRFTSVRQITDGVI
ncbi:membrane-associated protein, putative [Bodo saltans]|uniref:Membrane-associated protein, putative n=1 Tax=Bodo saltans TaxID=75058 RepID=A0A0S4IYB9_BODSA|nr:membrane-associated protein, putative [Bodo saltans]|eukprot:CUG53875.1 membrane-associated protein, putative [Bodo saltans]